MRNSLFLLLLIFYSCFSPSNKSLVINSGEAQGTYYHIKYLADYDKDFNFQIDSILQEVDSSLSIYKKYSLISRLNRGEKLKTDTLFNTVFSAAQKVFLDTEGSFDCSISPIVNEWGFYKEKLVDSLVIDSVKIRKILKNIGFQKIQLIGDSLVMSNHMKLDFNAIAQGFTVDLIANYLDRMNISDYLIELGGEIIAKGKNPDGKIWRIGVDKPLLDLDSDSRFQFILDLQDKALATSGNYRKFFEQDGVRYSHMIDPITGFPTSNRLLSATVIYDNCMLADAYATAFMVMGVSKTKEFIKNRPKLEVYLIYSGPNGEWKTYISPNMLERII